MLTNCRWTPTLTAAVTGVSPHSTSRSRDAGHGVARCAPLVNGGGAAVRSLDSLDRYGPAGPVPCPRGFLDLGAVAGVGSTARSGTRRLHPSAFEGFSVPITPGRASRGTGSVGTAAESAGPHAGMHRTILTPSNCWVIQSSADGLRRRGQQRGRASLAKTQVDFLRYSAFIGAGHPFGMNNRVSGPSCEHDP